MRLYPPAARASTLIGGKHDGRACRATTGPRRSGAEQRVHEARDRVRPLNAGACRSAAATTLSLPSRTCLFADKGRSFADSKQKKRKAGQQVRLFHTHNTSTPKIWARLTRHYSTRLAVP